MARPHEDRRPRWCGDWRLDPVSDRDRADAGVRDQARRRRHFRGLSAEPPWHAFRVGRKG